MAEENESLEERTLEPTERRLQKAREEGQIPQSRDLTTFAILGVLSITTIGLGPMLMSEMVNLVRKAFVFGAPDRLMDSLLEWAGGALLSFFLVAALFMVPLWLISMIAPLTLSSFKPNFAFKFNGARLNPLTGLGRMFSVNTLAELVKNVLKASLLLAIGLTYLYGLLGNLTSMGNQDFAVALDRTYSLIQYGYLLFIPPLLLIAGGDTFFQWFNFKKRMRMTQQEMRQELKETEGSPEVRAKLRQRQREMATSRMMAAIEKADVVLANPDHYSVALRYDPDKMMAPVVVGKGMDDVALRIQEIAKEHRVPIARIPPLTRLMYAKVDIGQQIPAQLFEAVAKILAWAYEIKETGDNSRDLPDIGAVPELDAGRA